MTIRHLDSLFVPASVAVFGASDRPHSVGATVWRNLHAHFKGTLYPVNPRLSVLDGATVYPDAAALPAAPALAIFCTAPDTLEPLLQTLGARGTRAAVIVTAGVSPEQQAALLQAARRHDVRLLGPGSIGLLVPHLGLHASFSLDATQPQNTPLTGQLAFVSQSGALVTGMLDWANAHGIGFSCCVAPGEALDIDVGDLLDYLGSDPRTRAILLYLENISAPRKFMSAARAAARNKPVIVVKAARSVQGQQAAAARLGRAAPTSADAVFDAALSRAGILRVASLQELFAAAELLARFRDNRNEQLIVLTNGGGTGVMAADAAADVGIPLATLSPAVVQKLDALLPGAWSRTNPIDIGNDAPPQRYADVLQLLREQRDSAILLVQTPTGLVSSTDVAQAVLPVASQRPPRVLASWLGHQAVAPARALFRQAGIPEYQTPEEAVRAFAFLRQYHRHQAELMETPGATPIGSRIDLATIRALIDTALAQGRDTLTAPEAQALLQAAGIPVQTAATSPQASAHTHELMLGASIDPLFGPVIVFGQGGSATDVLADRALALPPLNLSLAQSLIGRTRVARLLHGYGDVPPAHLPALTQALITVSQLLAQVPEIAELDINPFLVGPDGAVAQGARVRLSASGPAGAHHFAIRPYPEELIEHRPWGDGGTLTLRPIRPEDEPQHLAFCNRILPEDLRLRVFYSQRSMEHTELARLTQIDYDREMAFIATTTGPDGAEETLGSVRGICDPDNTEAEFGIIIRSDLKGKRLGWILMDKLIRYLRANGTRRVVGIILKENTGMLKLARQLGFVTDTSYNDDPEVRRLVLTL